MSLITSWTANHINLNQNKTELYYYNDNVHVNKCHINSIVNLVLRTIVCSTAWMSIVKTSDSKDTMINRPKVYIGQGLQYYA